MDKDPRSIRKSIISAGYSAISHLIEVAEKPIFKDGEEDGLGSDIAADRLKNAASAKKLAIEDAFSILSRITTEEELLSEGDNAEDSKKRSSHAERRARTT